MLQEHSHLATYSNHGIKSLVEHFSNNYLGIIAQWSALSTKRLVKQKAISPNDVFSNLFSSRPDGVKACLILLDLTLTSTPSTAQCEQGLSATNHFKCNLRTTLSQNTLSDLMQMPLQTMQWKPRDQTLQSVTGFLEQRQRDTWWRYSN